MNEQLSYENLLEQNRELQLRITRFSAIQQELINTRDRLDSELELYKRKQRYSSKALRVNNFEELYTLLSEGLVDILEVEFGIIHIHYPLNPENDVLIAEGYPIPDDASCFSTQLRALHASQGNGLCTSTQLAPFHSLLMNSVMLVGYVVEELNYEVYFVAGNSADNALSYPTLDNRHIQIFTLFANQMHLVLANLKRKKKIEDQFQQLKLSETALQKLSLIATKSKSGAIIADTNGRIEWVNEGFTAMSGYALHEIIGKKPKDFLHGPMTSQEAISRLSEALSQKKDIEIVVANYTKDGRLYQTQLEIISVFDEKGQHVNFIGIQKDVSEEIRHRNEVDAIRTFYEQILDFSPSRIIVFDQSHQVEYSNGFDFNHRLLDNENHHSIGKNQWIDQAQLERLLQRLDQASDLKTKIQFEDIHIDSEGQQQTYLWSIVPYIDTDGIPKHFIVMGTDVSELKKIQYDIVLKNEELKKINLELDQFVYSISHDLRSPLLSIKGLLNLVMRSPSLSEGDRKFLSLSIGSTERLDNTIQEILDFSRNSRQEVTQEAFDIGILVQTIFDDLRFSQDEQMVLNLRTKETTLLYSDKLRVALLLKNIIGNSIKYRRKDVTAVIDVVVSAKDDRIEIIVQDNGEGISEKHLSKVFDMFYRGTTNGVGTGLGLYICKEIVDKLSGQIAITSILGEGTAVTIHLPRLK